MSSPASSSTLPPRVLLGAWCTSLVHSLQRAGIRDVVISPGSRNTPLTLAALRASQLKCHSVTDERSAGFFALGLAKSSCRPVALLCTSGTAGAHYYPALIEASYSDVPLFVMTADRPAELQECGAPQTIRQQGLFQSFVRGEGQTQDPEADERAFEGLAHAVLHLAERCQKPRPGPVHLNVPLRKPLEPDLPSGKGQTARYDALLGAAQGISYPLKEAPPRVEPGVGPTPDLLKDWITAITTAERPLIVAGPLSAAEHRAVSDLAEHLKVPFLSEYGSAPDLNGLDFFPPLLLGSHAPDCILHFGLPCVSSAWAQYLSTFAGRYLVACGEALREPSRRAQSVIVSAIDSVIDVLRQRVSPRPPPQKGWGNDLCRLQERVNRTVDDALVSFPANTGLSEAGAVRTLLEALPTGVELALANSLSVRLASWVWGVSGITVHPHTFRGVNGIDGSVAAAAGICSVSQKPTALLIGDVALAHDVGSLALVRSLKQPLIIILLDNGGGRLFDHLPVRSHVPDGDFAYWTTQPEVDFELIFRAYGLSYRRIDRLEPIAPAVSQALSTSGASAIHLVVDSKSTLDFLARVRSALK